MSCSTAFDKENGAHIMDVVKIKFVAFRFFFQIFLSKVIITFPHRQKQTNIVAPAMCQRIKHSEKKEFFKNEAKLAIFSFEAFVWPILPSVRFCPGDSWGSLLSQSVP